MFICRPSVLKLTIFVIICLPSATFANPVSIKAAQWEKADNVKYCHNGNCETFRNIAVHLDTIALGQDISVTNLDTGAEIQVKRIRYGRTVKLCWLGGTEGMNEVTYITIVGCKQK